MMTRVACLAVMLLCASSMAGAQEIQLHPKVQRLEVEHAGPFVNISDDGVLCAVDTKALISHDDGRTWEAHDMFGERPLKVRPEQALRRLRDGSIVLIFLNENDRHWKWNKETNSTDGEVWLHTWSARSTDNGKTWTDIHKLEHGYNGAMRDVIETEKGTLVTPVQRYLTEHARHATIAYFSTDKGKSWQASHLLDSGGRGHHDGSIESTLVQLKDGRIWILLRTSLDYFWEAFSSDEGRTWQDFGPTKIDASSSPGILERLESGRLVLLWNRLYPEGDSTVARRGGQHSEAEASWFREELSMSFSDDDGKSWTDPVVIARSPKGGRVSYPYVLERRPGELWITTMQGGLRCKLNESDFVKGSR
jgi:sialidase-1